MRLRGGTERGRRGKATHFPVAILCSELTVREASASAGEVRQAVEAMAANGASPAEKNFNSLLAFAQSPAMKKRRSAVHLDNSVEIGLETQQDRDIEYITSVLKRDDRDLAQYLAGLLRDGVVQRAMGKVKVGPAPVQLGKKLPAKLRRLSGIPDRLKLKFVCMQVEALAPLITECAHDVEEADGDESDMQDTVHAKVTFDAEILDALMAFALNCDLSVKAPSAHYAAQFENPMLAVLTARAQKMGNRLAKLTLADIQGGLFGFWRRSNENPTKATDIEGRTVVLCWSDDMLKQMTDLRLADSWNMNARLVSEKTGYSQNLHTLLTLQKKVSFPDFFSPFEEIDSTLRFKDMVTPELEKQLSESAGKGKAKAKATAGGKKAGGPKVQSRKSRKAKAAPRG